MAFEGRTMPRTISIALEVPGDLARFRFPKALNRRLQSLLDKQDGGSSLSAAERQEAAGLVEMAEVLSWLRLRAQRSNGRRGLRARQSILA
jgi:hypothetical protein